MHTMTQAERKVNELAKATIEHLDGLPPSHARARHKLKMIGWAERAALGTLCCGQSHDALAEIQQAAEWVEREAGAA